MRSYGKGRTRPKSAGRPGYHQVDRPIRSGPNTGKLRRVWVHERDMTPAELASVAPKPPPPPAWRDATSYQRDESPRVPRCWTVELLSGLDVSVHRFPPLGDGWYVSAYRVGIERRPLKATEAEDARAEGLAVVHAAILAHSASIAEFGGHEPQAFGLLRATVPHLLALGEKAIADEVLALIQSYGAR